ncbi:MAG: hypothetical protein ACR2RV_11750 [Verrucomicrobiales bacterium]
MSTPNSEGEHPAPLWLNAAAIAGLALFLTAGFFLLRHYSDRGTRSESPTDAVASDGFDSAARGITPSPRIIRPGEQDGRIVFADTDASDADEFRLLAERSPKAAAKLVSRMPDSPDRDERMYDLMQIWVSKDPTQAADWVSGLPFSGMKNDATAELGLAWGKSDPQAAAQWVDENIFTENAPAGAASLTSAWARIDIEAATEWVDSLDIDAPARKEAIRALAFHLGEIDPTRGLAWLARLKPEDRNLIIVNFAASWSDSSPQAAANWMRYQSGSIDPRTRDQATLAVIHSWAANESEAASASNWIDNLADGEFKEKAKATFAESHAETSPAEALPWAQSINDPERRLEATMVVMEEWVLQDREDFKAGITGEWESFDEGLRHEIYDLLIDHDPEFKKELYSMFEERPAEPVE